MGYTTPLFAHNLSCSYNLMPALHPLMCDTTSWRTPDDGENTLRSLLYPTRFAQKGDTATLFPRPLMEKPGGCIDFLEKPGGCIDFLKERL